MATFQYEAMNSQGQAVKHEVEAASAEDAIAKLRSQNLFPTSVKEKAGKQGAGAGAGGPKKGGGLTIGTVSKKQLTTFTRQLSTLQDAGLPIVRSLRILEGQMKAGVLKNTLGNVADDIEGGSTLSDAMAKYPRAFDKLYVNMVKAGEAGGVLDTILQRLADFREKSQKLKKKIIGAMVYPVVVICIAGCILAGIMIYIVPKFEKMFVEMEVELPALTVWVTKTATLMATRWYLIPIIPVSIFVVIKLIGMSRFGRLTLDRIKLKIPVFGVIISKSVLARFTRTLGTLIASGVPILEALNITKETTGNAVVARAIADVHDSIREGDTIAEPLAKSKVVDDMVVNMVDVGEETGDLDKMLIKVADTYDEDIDTAVASMVSLLEPAMIVVLGVCVGTIVIALFLPLIKLMSELGG